MAKRNWPHDGAIDYLLSDERSEPVFSHPKDPLVEQHTTSLSLARALGVSLLSRLGEVSSPVHVWDPAAGTGYAGALLVGALTSTGTNVRFRGQDISSMAVEASQKRFEGLADAEIVAVDSLQTDAFEGYAADLAIVDAPWGLRWDPSVVQPRHDKGAFPYGLPNRGDSSWLFISLALAKLRSPDEGGGRVAALVDPGALSSGGSSAAVRKRILEEGLLESVTRLPDGLAPNTALPLYLLTFSNRPQDVRRDKVLVADLQAMFSKWGPRRSMSAEAFRELVFGLKTRKSGPRARLITLRQLIRRDVWASRATSHGKELSWKLTTYGDTSVDDELLEARYGEGAGVSLTGVPEELLDLDPSRFFAREARELHKGLESRAWPRRRLSGFLEAAPEVADADGEAQAHRVFVPTGRGRSAVGAPAVGVEGRVISVAIDADRLDSTFLAAWLNTPEGMISRRLAIDAAGKGAFVKAVRSDGRSLTKWAEELTVPVPPLCVQKGIASADKRLRYFQSELDSELANIWAKPESAADIVDRFERAFDDSLEAWLDQLPYPVASALWTAVTVAPMGDQQEAYFHAWEGMAAFHATVLLSACRTDASLSQEIEDSIRRTFHKNGLGIERASFKTWVIIAEKVARELRRVLGADDVDDEARVFRAFAGLSRDGIERLTSPEVIRKFNDVNHKRNVWDGHGGFAPPEEKERRVTELINDLKDLKTIIGDVWMKLRLVRAGRSKRGRDGYLQEAEVVIGTRSPFVTQEFAVGDPMIHGDLYLIRDGSESPLPLAHFVQLRSAPRSAQFTTYFYNRTEGSNVRMVSYQHGPDGEIVDDVEAFRDQFGALAQQ
ncbi:N-6 DNA methylase [Nesterenkonia lacusekhoensis]|uniref:site-specific DNA-methyltransferase (adenine-specific) n=1 Tax=Nesterenkonia lacusekhoensis TaxID=150832 RepID=A0ABS4T257_9MICC|nr:N-6 DNA methylase [Nesterenkonia lacusekhoensis]MBP2318527.1 hypothetical protein [Nesterenkonia lacusekhoensis]